MPLHLLSKKSWNVYAPANRARVARDEALAEAAARDAERDRRDGKSASTIAALRHENERRPSELSDQDKLILKATKDLSASNKDSKKRKRIPGEDDTDRDLRYAKEQQDRRSQGGIARLRADRNEDADAPMVDAKGYTNLFPEHKPRHDRFRKSELQKEREQQQDAQEEQGMQLKDAFGRKDPKAAWYMDKDGTVKDAVGKDVWGNEDPRRQQRAAQRLMSSDPLAFMKIAQVRLKESKREREEREIDLRRNRTREDPDFLDFSLDAKPPRSKHYHSRNDDSRRMSHRSHRERPSNQDRHYDGPQKLKSRHQPTG